MAMPPLVASGELRLSTLLVSLVLGLCVVLRRARVDAAAFVTQQPPAAKSLPPAFPRSSLLPLLEASVASSSQPFSKPSTPPVLPLFAAAAAASLAVAVQSRTRQSRVARRGTGKAGQGPSNRDRKAMADAGRKPIVQSGLRYGRSNKEHLKNQILPTYEELTNRGRYEPLVWRYKQKLAKDGQHKLAARRCRTTGLNAFTKRRRKMYRIIDFGRKKRGIYGTVEDVLYDPYRNARICLIDYEDGEKLHVLWAIGMFKGQQIIADRDAAPFVGNAMPLGDVPPGTNVHCVEMHPEYGGLLARAAGSCCIVLSKGDTYTTLKMPSGEIRMLKNACWCTIGRVGRMEANQVNTGWAGPHRWLGWRPHVRGIAKNSQDHPHGGGEGKSPIGHKHPKTPFGKPAHGMLTRKRNQPSTKLILVQRIHGRREKWRKI